MASNRANRLASLLGSSPSSDLPDPSKRLKRNHSLLSDIKDLSPAIATSNPFKLIMRDPNADILDESRPTKRKKTMEFLRAVDPQEPGISTPTAPISGSDQHFCGFRLKNQTIPSEILQSSLQDRELLPLEKLEERVAHVRRFWRNKSMHSGDLVIVGVVCHIWRRSLDEAKLTMVERESGQSKPSSPAPSKNQVEIEKLEDRQMSKLLESRELGEMMVVRVTDLRRNSVCIALDPRFKRDLLKYSSVVAILNPKFVHALDGDGVVLQIEKESQLCVVGQSSDIGICRYRKPTSKPSSTLSPLPTAPSASSSLLLPLPSVQPPSCSTSVATSPEDSTFGASTAAAEADPALIASPKLSTKTTIASPIAATPRAPQMAPSTAKPMNNHSTPPTPCSASHGNAKTSSKSLPTSISNQEICPNFIDLSVSEYCDYHMFLMFSEQKSNRMVLNDPGGGSLSSLQKRSEISESAKHLSDGVFALCQLKWKISTRNVKLAPSNDLAVAPSASQIEKISTQNPRGGRNLKASVLGIHTAETPEDQLKEWKKDRATSPAARASQPKSVHPNSSVLVSRKG